MKQFYNNLLSNVNPELGLAAMAVGRLAGKANIYVGNVANKKQEIVNKCVNFLKTK